MRNKKIYIVTKGEYSDYRIDSVFSTEDLAKEYLDGKSDDYRMEVYNIDEPMPKHETRLWRIRLDAVTKKLRFAEYAYNDDVKDTVCMYKWYDGAKTKKGLTFYIESDSKERAVKIASERFGQVVAEEPIRFPYLRSKIIDDKYTGGNFPLYDFKTGEIVLHQWQEFADTFLTYDPETYDESKIQEYLPKGVTFRIEK